MKLKLILTTAIVGVALALPEFNPDAFRSPLRVRLGVCRGARSRESNTGGRGQGPHAASPALLQLDLLTTSAAGEPGMLRWFRRPRPPRGRQSR